MATRQAPAVGGWGLALVAAGAALVLLAFYELDWYSVTATADAAPEATFPNLRHSIDQFGGASAASAYFDWLSWTLLIVVIVLGAVANVDNPVRDLARVLGFVVGVAGIAATYYALLQYADAQAAAGATRHNPLFNGTWGLMAVLLGFALTAIGAVLGPRRRADSGAPR